MKKSATSKERQIVCVQEVTSHFRRLLLCAKLSKSFERRPKKKTGWSAPEISEIYFLCRYKFSTVILEYLAWQIPSETPLSWLRCAEHLLKTVFLYTVCLLHSKQYNSVKNSIILFKRVWLTTLGITVSRTLGVRITSASCHQNIQRCLFFWTVADGMKVHPWLLNYEFIIETLSNCNWIWEPVKIQHYSKTWLVLIFKFTIQITFGRTTGWTTNLIAQSRA